MNSSALHEPSACAIAAGIEPPGRVSPVMPSHARTGVRLISRCTKFRGSPRVACVAAASWLCRDFRPAHTHSGGWNGWTLDEEVSRLAAWNTMVVVIAAIFVSGYG